MNRYCYCCAVLAVAIFISSAALSEDSSYRIAWENRIEHTSGHGAWTSKSAAAFDLIRLRSTNPAIIYYVERRTKTWLFMRRLKPVTDEELFPPPPPKKNQGGP